jgi:hypothetical protein
LSAALRAVTVYAEAGYALAVAGAAMVWPPAALLVAAAYLIALAVVNDRRGQPEAEQEPPQLQAVK